MRKLSSLLTATVLLAALLPAKAQNTSPYWSLAGNSNATSSSKLGTTNNINLRLYTNNAERVRILSANGYVGIGTTAPNARLQVVGATGTNPLRVQVGGNTKLLVHSGGGVAVGANLTPPANGLYVSGNVGIGTTSPSNKLDVIGRGAFSNGLSVFESGIYTVHSTGNALEGYGETASYGSGVYGSGYRGVYGSGNGYGVQGYSYNGYGAYGESVNNYGGYFISTNSWGLRAETTSGPYAGVFYGKVWTSTGYETSDRNLKQNIEVFSDAMDIINKLKPRHYQFKTDEKYRFLNLPKGDHYGLIAQDVEQLLPNLVSTADHEVLKRPQQSDASKPYTNGLPKPTAQPAGKPETISVKALNYVELIPIMVKGMQEQSELIKQQQQQINELKVQVSRLSGNVTTTTGMGSLSQNTPNPVERTARIVYAVPAGAGHAHLLITDNLGRTVKSVSLSKSGYVNIDVSSLSSGIYNYTLLVDGKITDTKKMEVLRK